MVSLRWSLAAVAAAACTGSQLRRRPPPVKMVLKSQEDLRVTASIIIGDTPVECIMDTGSPEQVFFSSECHECGGKFDCDRDPSCSWGEHEAVQSYGSGETYSTSARANITLVGSDKKASIQVPRQMLWLVTSAALDFSLDGTLQCIFGLGPASSAVKFAIGDRDKLQEQVDMLPENLAKEDQMEVDRLSALVSYMQSVTLWQQAARVEQFSFCLHPDLGRDGRLIFYDDAPQRYSHAFMEVPAVQSSMYWELPMGTASITFKEHVFSSCEHRGGCNAIMDTGTSLIGAPIEFVDALSEQLEREFPQYGCEADALDRYPNFTITLGEHTMTLSPRSYVCKFDTNDWKAGLYGQTLGVVQRRMPHVSRFLDAHVRRFDLQRNQGIHTPSQERDYFCAPCLFDTSHDLPNEEWLFGLPFFREMYTTFRTSQDSRQAKAMLFATADEVCTPGGSRVHSTSGAPIVKLEKLLLPHPNRRAHPRGHAVKSKSPDSTGARSSV